MRKTDLNYLFSDDYLREGLISEIKVMQKLKSPNIV